MTAVNVGNTTEEHLDAARDAMSSNDFNHKRSVLAQLPDVHLGQNPDGDEVDSKLSNWIEEHDMAEADEDEQQDDAVAKRDDVEVIDPTDGDGDTEVTDDKRDEAEERLRKVREISERENELFLSLAEELFVIRRDSLYQYMLNPHTDVPYEAMSEFIEVETEHSKRTVHYLMSIWEYYVEQYSREFLESVQHLGWTKLKELEGWITPDNRDEWLEFCEEHSVSDIKGRIEDLEDDEDDSDAGEEPSPEGETQQTERVSFDVTEEQADTVNKALKVAMDIAETDNKSEAFVLAMTEFLSGHQDAVDDPVPVRKFLDDLEDQIGVDIAAFQGNSIIFGDDTITKYANKMADEEADKAS